MARLLTGKEYRARVRALEEKYPLMFAEGGISNAIMPGWLANVERLCDALDGAMTMTARVDFRIVRIREKCGLLRVVLNHGSEDVNDLVHQAEKDSATVCVFCGGTGKMRNYDPAEQKVSGWVHPACDEHANRSAFFSDDDSSGL